MRPEEVEDRAVPFGEVAAAEPIEVDDSHEALRRSEHEVECVLDAEKPHPLVVQARPFEFVPGNELGELQAAETPVTHCAVGGMRSNNLAPEEVLQTVLVARSIELRAGPLDRNHSSAPRPVELVVADPVGPYEPTQLDEEVWRDRLVGVDVIGLRNDAEDSLRILARQRGQDASASIRPRKRVTAAVRVLTPSLP
jgi:hypothetical protein